MVLFHQRAAIPRIYSLAALFLLALSNGEWTSNENKVVPQHPFSENFKTDLSAPSIPDANSKVGLHSRQAQILENSVCEDVNRLVSTIALENGTFEYREVYTCYYFEEGADSPKLVELRNLPTSFDAEFKDAFGSGKNNLVLSGATLNDRILSFPDAAFLASDYIWQYPLTLDERKLAVKQNGIKTAVIIRVTLVTSNGTLIPPVSLEEASESIFGTERVSAASQYDLCSYGQYGLENAGVYNLTREVTSLHYAHVLEDVDDLVVASEEVGGLALNVKDFNHILYILPTGVVFDGLLNWVAFAYTVSDL